MTVVTVDQAIQQALQHHQAGQLAEAEAMYRLALEQSPNHPDALHLLGMLARRVGKFDVAENLIRHAIAVNRASADYHANLGLVLMDQHKLNDAIVAFKTAIQFQPRFAQAYCNLGIAFERSGQIDQAIDSFESAISFNPRFFEAYSNLGNALSKQKKFDAAIAALRKAVELNPNSGDVNYNIGHALRESGQLEEAIVYFNRAIELNPNHLTARCDLANLLHLQQSRHQVIQQYQQVLAIDPDHAIAHWNLALTYLLLGDFKRGWTEHEWRTRCESLANPAEFDKPRWTGEPLDGKTILLHPEQGLGDILQFVRYAPMVTARGGKVLLQCQPPLVRLLQNDLGISQVISVTDPLPEFDVHCPVMSLPFVFGTEIGSIPAQIPYLFADPEDAAAWRLKLENGSNKPRIGLVWAGSPTHKNDRNRSIRLANLSRLLSMDSCRFFSLQKGPASNQLSMPTLIDHTADLHDFADTAAFVANLDLIITVDTAVAHLAGGMGKIVWLLLPHNPDWRWLLDRDDSPWYPTMRIFRQQRAGDWESVITRIVAEIISFV
jgi:tetratricopeptide (TPR) repeat protein